VGRAVTPAGRAAARSVWPVLLTETRIVGTGVGAVGLGGWVLLLALLLLVGRVGYEVARVALNWPQAQAFGAGVGLALALWAVTLVPFSILATGVSLIWITLAALRFLSQTRLWGDLALFPILPLTVFVAAALDGQGALLLAAFLLVETFDSYALLGGKLMGRRPAFPVLSPRKTIEGLATGAIMLMVTAALVGPLVFQTPVLLAIGAAALAGTLSVAGDLAATRIKRQAGVKDYPQVLPHQGGLFDITDAWIATTAGLALAGLVAIG